MTTLLDYCSLIRSKNAGPFTLTFDLMCKDQDSYDALVGSGSINRELVADLYGCQPNVVTLVNHPGALAVKISMPRPHVQGDLRDSDCYAGQQYAPLLDVQIDDPRKAEVDGAEASDTGTPRLVTLAHLPDGHPARDLLLGHTPVFACQADQRFSYMLYVPSTYSHDGPTQRLLVALHGTERGAEAVRQGLVDHAEKNATVVLAPLFPAGIDDPNDVDNYKFIKYGELRFDEILLAMVDEVAQRWNVDGSRFALHGFSGGGQFAHRFLYLHPSRLTALSIGAPGRVTLPYPDQNWWHGVGDLEEIFGIALDLAAVRQVPIHIVVGEADDDTTMWTMVESGDDAGCRLDRARSLAEGLSTLGCDVTLDVVPGVGHAHEPLLPHVINFLDGADRTV